MILTMAHNDRVCSSFIALNHTKFSQCSFKSVERERERERVRRTIQITFRILEDRELYHGISANHRSVPAGINGVDSPNLGVTFFRTPDLSPDTLSNTRH